MDIRDLLVDAIQKRSSDLHLTAENPPVLRIDGELVVQNQVPSLTPEDLERLLSEIINEEQKKRFENELELDFAHNIEGLGRFRANACVQRGTISLCFRLLQVNIPDMEELGLPDICKDLALKERGLIIVSGPTGSGKSTTLASMVKYINNFRRRRIITIEDPIEFLHENNTCFITQRELGTDTLSFGTALKHALRQDPDVILVGEMRDLETISIALTAAETGHLILATLHTPSAPQAVDRIIDIFPPYQQPQVRVQLSTTLEGILYQTLLPKFDGSGRTAAVEVMMASDAIKNLIREGKTSHMWNVLQTGAQFGMQTLDQALVNLYHNKTISFEEAISRCRDPETAKKTLGRV
ncbi:MAG: type IV pilus twitching motility protein PilT [Chloroflexota bacterium]|nr:type IV pilus twitching motility protein PilT [Chloroflexota bacterium]